MKFLLVFIGGGFGALVRYLLYLILPKITYFPSATLVSNFFGCFIAMIVFLYFISESETDSAYKTFLIVGFCGGLSTLSALSLELAEYIHEGQYIRAFAYTTATIMVCSLAILLGLLVAKSSFNFKL